jgi:hypothetical protein
MFKDFNKKILIMTGVTTEITETIDTIIEIEIEVMKEKEKDLMKKKRKS